MAPSFLSFSLKRCPNPGQLGSPGKARSWPRFAQGVLCEAQKGLLSFLPQSISARTQSLESFKLPGRQRHSFFPSSGEEMSL